MLPKDSELNYAATDAAYKAMPILTEELKEAALLAEWPSRVTQYLTVDFDGENLYVKYPEQLSAEIDDLEYGKPYGLPQPVIRPFIARSEGILKSILVLYTVDDLMEMEEVF